MVLKQLALERVVRAADANEARCEMAVWRLQDADNQAKRLAADNTQLRCGGGRGAYEGRVRWDRWKHAPESCQCDVACCTAPPHGSNATPHEFEF